MGNLPPKVKARVDDSKLLDYRELNLRECELKKFPSKILTSKKLKDIVKLNISKNFIRKYSVT